MKGEILRLAGDDVDDLNDVTTEMGVGESGVP